MIHKFSSLLCRWPSITEWEIYITAQGCRLQNDLYCVEWNVKLYYTIVCVIICHMTGVIGSLYLTLKDQVETGS